MYYLFEILYNTNNTTNKFIRIYSSLKTFIIDDKNRKITFSEYNYYPINCINIHNVNETIIATYQGKLNEPNIMLKKGNEIINYQDRKSNV